MTSLENYRNDNPRTASEIADEIEAELQTIRPSAPVVRGTEHYALIQSIASAFETTEESFTELYDAGFITDATGEELTKKARELGVQRQDAVAATGVVQFNRDSPASRDYVIPSGTVVSTGGEDGVSFTTTETVTLASGTSSVEANIRCTETGAVGNVGADTIQFLTSGSVSGVDSVTNPQAVGDPAFTLTDGETLQTTGQPRESDESLRERALQSTTVGGAGTAEAAQLAVENLEGVISADVVTNRTPNTVNGIDPWHTEVRVYGGEIGEIADRLYETLPLITLQTLQGGVNGTAQSVTLSTDFYGEITVPITRPTEQTASVTIDVVHDAAYAGDVAVKNAVVGYVGGQTVDERTVTGLGQGDNVLINEIENVTEDVRGVEYAEVTLYDVDGDGTDDTTTDADGVPVYEVADSEVATVDATNITLNTTER
jgi:hypothetical protein